MLREATGKKDVRRFLPAAPAKNPMRTEPGPGALHGTTPMHAAGPFLHKKTRRATPGSLEKSFPTVLSTKPSILLRSLQYRSGVFQSNQNCAKCGNRQGVARRVFLCRNGPAACEIACAQPSPSITDVNDGFNDMQTRAASAEAARVRS